MADDKNKYQDDAIIGGTGLGAAGLMAKSQLDKGNLTGRETLYHGTKPENINSILENGILYSKANDPKTYSRVATGLGSELDDLVYLSRKKKLSEQMNVGRMFFDDSSSLFEDTGKIKSIKSSVLKSRVPVWKLHKTDNPEVLGAKNWKEFLQKQYEANPNYFAVEPGDKSLLGKFQDYSAKKSYNKLNKDTVTIKGDIGPEFIKGSGKYQRAGAEEVKDFVMKNKKRFGKGAGSVLGAGLAAGIGAKYLLDKNEKKASVKDGMKRAIKSVKDLQSGATKQKASAEAKEAERLYNVFRNKVGDKPEYLKDIREYKARMKAAQKKEKIVNAGTGAVKATPFVGVAGGGIAGKSIYDEHKKTASLIDAFYEMMMKK